MLNPLHIPDMIVRGASTLCEDGQTRPTVTFEVEWVQRDERGNERPEPIMNTCPKCGSSRLHLDGRPQSKTITDAPAFGNYVKWRVSVQTYECQSCKRRSHLVPDAVDLDRCMTRRCVAYVERLAALRPFLHASEEVGLSPVRIATIARSLWEGLPTYNFPVPRYLGIDEIALNAPGDARRHPPRRAVFTDLESGQVLDILNDNKLESVLKWLRGLQQEIDRRRKTLAVHEEKEWIRAIVSDFEANYRRAACNAMPHTPFVIDRYHVHSLIRERIRDIFAKAINKSHPGIDPRGRQHDTILGMMKGKVFSDADLIELPLSTNPGVMPEVLAAKKALQEFEEIWEVSSSSIEAAAALESWVHWLPSNIKKHLDKFIDQLRRTPGVLDFFDTRITNGPAEAANGVIRLIHDTHHEIACTQRESATKLNIETLRKKMRARAKYRPKTEFYCDGCFLRTPLRDKFTSSSKLVRGSDCLEDTHDDEPFWLCTTCNDAVAHGRRHEDFPLGRKWPGSANPSPDIDGDEAEEIGLYDLVAWARFNLTLPAHFRHELTPRRERRSDLLL